LWQSSLRNTYKKNGPSGPTWSHGGGVRTNQPNPPWLRACDLWRTKVVCGSIRCCYDRLSPAIDRQSLPLEHRRRRWTTSTSMSAPAAASHWICLVRKDRNWSVLIVFYDDHLRHVGQRRNDSQYSRSINQSINVHCSSPATLMSVRDGNMRADFEPLNGVWNKVTINNEKLLSPR